MFSLKIEHERHTDENKIKDQKLKKSRPAFHDRSNLLKLSNAVTYLICYVKRYIIGSTKHQEH